VRHPYIDFHYGNGFSQDYNARLINNADGSLDVQMARPNNGGNGLTPLQITAAHTFVNYGVGQGTGIKHARTNASCTTGNDQGDTCTITLSWAGTAFADTNYTVVCEPKGGPGSQNADAYVYVSDSTKATSSVGVTIKTLNSLPATLSGVQCIAIHD
jgi:hypothetical protein